MRRGAVVGAIRVTWRHSDSGPGFDERTDDADGARQNVLVTRHGAARQVRGPDLPAERCGDRVRPRDPLKLRDVHDSSTSREHRSCRQGTRFSRGCGRESTRDASPTRRDGRRRRSCARHSLRSSYRKFADRDAQYHALNPGRQRPVTAVEPRRGRQAGSPDGEHRVAAECQIAHPPPLVHTRCR